MLLILNISLLFFAWAVVFPVQAVELLKNIRQRLDQYLIELVVKKEIQTLRRQFRTWGIRKGFQLEVIDEVLAEYSNEIHQHAQRSMQGWM